MPRTLDPNRMLGLRTLAWGVNWVRAGVFMFLGGLLFAVFAIFLMPFVIDAVSAIVWLAAWITLFLVGIVCWLVGLVRLRRHATQGRERRHLTAGLVFFFAIPAAGLAFLDPSFEKAVELAAILAAALFAAAFATTCLAVREIAVDAGWVHEGKARAAAILQSAAIVFAIIEGVLSAVVIFGVETILNQVIAILILLALSPIPISGLRRFLWILTQSSPPPPRPWPYPRSIPKAGPARPRRPRKERAAGADASPVKGETGVPGAGDREAGADATPAGEGA